VIETGQFSRQQQNQIQYLLQQSIQGHHVLFGTELVKRAFTPAARSLNQAEAEAYAAEPHLERLMAEPSLEGKRAYLESLEDELLVQVVRTYFNIVENTIGTQH
jgi:hypothetical protein